MRSGPSEVGRRMVVGAWVVGLVPLVVGGCASGSNEPPPLPPPAPTVAVIPGTATPGAGSAGPPDSGEAAPTFDDLFGVYQHVGGDADADARDEAIEEFVGGVFFLGRGIARDKLKVASEIDRRIALRRDGATIEVQLGERFDLKAALGGPGVTVVGTDGDDLQLTFERRGSALVQLAKGDRGGTRRVFTPQRGGALLVQVTIYAAQVDGAVDYELRYQRVDR